MLKQILQVKSVSKCPEFLFKGELETRLGKWFFKRIDATIGSLVDEIYIQFRKDGLYLSAIDSSHVAMALFKLSREDFNGYEIQEEFKIGINVSNLGKVFNNLIKLNDELINIQVKTKDKIKFNKASLKTVEILEYDEKEDTIMETFQEVLEDKWISQFSMSEGNLRSEFTSCEVMSDLVKLSTSKDTVTFYSYDESGDYENEFTKNDEELVEWDLTDSEGLYSLSFLLAFIQSNSFSPKRLLKKDKDDNNEYITVKLGYKIPALLQLNFSNSYLKYLIAPRVEDDDEDDDYDDDFDVDDFDVDNTETWHNMDDLDEDLPIQEPVTPKIIPNSIEISMLEYYPQIEHIPRTVPNQIDPRETGYIDGDEHVIFIDSDYIPVQLPNIEFVKASDLLDESMDNEVNRVVSEMNERGELSSRSRIREKQIHQIKGQINKRGI
jgi:DNA polymerase III sliding clamp (beta) subunit (PCNA family)